MNNYFSIVPLSPENISEATTLAHHIFPLDAQEEKNPGLAFQVSLHPDKFPEFFQNDECDELKYLVAVNNQNNEVLGTTGWYHLKDDSSEIVWLGWYCVKESYRRKGIGKALLEFTISKARAEGRKVLRLYSDESATEAQKLYEKFGFIEYNRSVEDGWVTVYRHLKL